MKYCSKNKQDSRSELFLQWCREESHIVPLSALCCVTQDVERDCLLGRDLCHPQFAVVPVQPHADRRLAGAIQSPCLTPCSIGCSELHRPMQSNTG